METLIKDIRYGFRSLLKHPGFAAIAVITLALGIGANTAIFSVVNAVLLQPLPYRNAHELVLVQLSPTGNSPDSRYPFSPAIYLHLKSHNTVFTDVAALSNKGWPANLTDAGEPERLQGFQVSANLFSVLGVAPELGRTFVAEEDRAGANQVVVISYDLWQRRFGGDRSIVGRKLTLNGDVYSVLGVLPRDFRFFTKTDVWTPLAFTATEMNDRNNNYLELVARRKPGISFTQAGTETDRITREFINEPTSDLHGVLSSPQELLTKEVRPMLRLLMAAVGFVLLIACVNMTNITLARGTTRRRELAVRAALGAGRLRLGRLLLVESTMLALIGGAVGLLLAYWSIQFLASGLPEYLVDANSTVAFLGIDKIALGFTLTVSLITGILFGVVPAWQLSRFNLNDELKEGGRTAGGRSRVRSALVVAEVTLAMVTLVGAGLMIKSFWRLAHVNPGYEPAGLLTAKIDPAGPSFEQPGRTNAFYQELLTRVSNIPGISEVGIINSLNSGWSFTIDEHPPIAPEQRPSAQSNQVSAGYFRAMGIPLRAGRFFDDHDAQGAPLVAVIDERIARRDFPSENPIGKHLRFWDKSWEIVGVVGSARYWSLDSDPAPHVYVSYLQENWRSMSLRVRTRTGDPMALEGPIRAELAAIDKNQPIHSFKPQSANVAELVAPQRFTALLLAGFAAMAALLAAVGIYGVTSYSVTQSTRDIGVRMALGARPGSVLRLVVGKGMILALVGVAIGVMVSYWLTNLMATLLFEVKPTDAVTFATVAIGLLIVALVACYIPARRATKIDPLVALRYE
ncbi:MAG: ABC transporter permease [Pyrinomonadaceae bacterium]|nr:ABC transporter permease [Pyrinomonadaceae bacterium]